jgi:hypothetical protein
MSRKRVAGLMAGVLFSLLVAGVALMAAAGATARATQHPANQSGVMGAINFRDTGTAIVVTGTATGLAPSTLGRYVTLVYDVGSVPGGPTNCEPTAPMPNMFIGFWTSDAGGNGILHQVGQPPPFGAFDTVSIRDTTINNGFGPQAVVACGQVAVNP